MPEGKTGFIGLGLMGRAMVGRLQDTGHAVSVLGNRDRTGVEEALARGAAEAASAREMAESCDAVMLCVATSEQVESRIYGEDGILAGTRPGQVVVDFGTSLPSSTLKIGADLAERGAHYLDAPLGRTPAHAKDGLLNIMCAGDRGAFESVKPLLDALGENVFHLGALGSGHTVKLINNYFGMTVACGMAEAFAMADASGVGRREVFEVMAAGPNHSAMMDFIGKYATEGENGLGFSIANAAKDLGYYRRMAEDLGVSSIMSVGADAALSGAARDGAGERMVPEMVDWMAARLKGRGA